jgi:hypothetical protein
VLYSRVKKKGSKESQYKIWILMIAGLRENTSSSTL